MNMTTNTILKGDLSTPIDSRRKMNKHMNEELYIAMVDIEQFIWQAYRYLDRAEGKTTGLSGRIYTLYTYI